MLKFEEAALELIKFAFEDVITTSSDETTQPAASKDPDEGEDNEF